MGVLEQAGSEIFKGLFLTQTSSGDNLFISSFEVTRPSHFSHDMKLHFKFPTSQANTKTCPHSTH